MESLTILSKKLHKKKKKIENKQNFYVIKHWYLK